MPGRDGGRRGKRVANEAWRKRASHAIDELNLRPPIKELGYGPKFREPIENAAYRLDQAFASARISYSVQVPEKTNFLSVKVSESDAVAAKAVVLALVKKDHAI
jgi:hypothetical protein